VQKLEFWDGKAINFSKISASIRLMYSVRLFKNNKQAYNVIPAKQYSLFFFGYDISTYECNHGFCFNMLGLFLIDLLSLGIETVLTLGYAPDD
jgi:hypothetical protein